ncbi:uncharacterized protein [Procambarus clarkii]|uniref:uncharacterized protein n=1 Tax=Procambarus clarkii TaxID=6728 RepID=UPI0037430E42
MCDGYQISFELSQVNGSFVLKPIITPCPQDPTPIIAGSFLSVIFLVAFILNLMVVVTVSTSYTLKRFLYCHLLINLCLASMVDCFFNLSIAIGYVFTTQWRFGYDISYLNSFTINMMNSEMAFAVVLLAIDRLAAAKKYNSFLQTAKSKFWLMILTTWVLSFLMAVPLVCGYIKSIPYRNRYSCCVADPLDDNYLIIHLVLVVCVPTVVMVALVCITSVIFHRERRKQKKVKGNQTIGYFEQILMTPYFRNEFYPAVFAMCIVIVYLVLWLPFTALSIINPMVTQHWANQTTNTSTNNNYNLFTPSAGGNFKVTRAMLDESQLRAVNMTPANITSDMTPDMSNITVNEGLIPEILDTSVFDTVAVWFRFIFDVLVPILVFSILRDVRVKCEGLIMCCRPNSVDVASPKPTRPYANRLPTTQTSEKKDGSGKSQKKQKSNNKDTIDFKTPILFSTSEGLHIRTVEDTFLDMKENKPLLGFMRQIVEPPKFVYSLCDVMLGYEELTDFDGQYHIDDNYDFEKEPVVVNMGNGNPVVLGAQRAAAGQKSPETTEDVDDVVNKLVDLDYRPPTPPKVPVEGNDSAENVGETIEVDDGNKKKKKVVRFATMLNEIIPPRPITPESSIDSSSASTTRSSDSGIEADSEYNLAHKADMNRKPKLTTDNKRQHVSAIRIEKNLPTTIATQRPPGPYRKPPTTSGKQPSTFGKSHSTSGKPSVAAGKPHATSGNPSTTSGKPNSTSGKPPLTSRTPHSTSHKPSELKTSEKISGSNIHNIKSRHITNLSPSKASPTTNGRFSKAPSGQHSKPEGYASR